MHQIVIFNPLSGINFEINELSHGLENHIAFVFSLKAVSITIVKERGDCKRTDTKYFKS